VRTISYQVFLSLAVMTTFRLAHLWTPCRDVVGKLPAVIAPEIANNVGYNYCFVQYSETFNLF